ncbi:hypothetical protein [Alkalibaculum bacchi]|uniref:hypothetical protein n=1 Tax=Alkalibaculum bacchi TaxID=645887 RepID=UPI0011BD87DC|nr:hypothetical protein [Alkalibaculum bacchi]
MKEGLNNGGKFIDPLIVLSGIVLLIGIVIGLVRKNKKLLIISIIVFAIVVLIFVLEGLLIE